MVAVQLSMSTYLMVPGAGGDPWYWHRVTPLLREAGHEAVAVELPAASETAGLEEYRDAVVVAGRQLGSLVLVAQSMGCYAATMAVSLLDVASLLLVNPMVPAPGESPGEWWLRVDQPAVARRAAEHDARPVDFDPDRDFFHDVPPAVRATAFERGVPAQAQKPFSDPWPLDGWPDVTTRVLSGLQDRLFPVELQRRLARDRIGVGVETVPGGHLVALSRPVELVARILER